MAKEHGVKLEPEAHDELRELYVRMGIPMTEIASRLIVWLSRQDHYTQGIILGVFGDAAGDLARIIVLREAAAQGEGRAGKVIDELGEAFADIVQREARDAQRKGAAKRA